MVVFGVVLATASVPARGQGQLRQDTANEAADARLREGLDLYDQGKYQEALDAFRSGYALVPAPNLRFNIGLAFRRLNLNDQALEIFQLLSDDSLASSNLRAEAARQVALLTKSLCRLHFVLARGAGAKPPALRIGSRDYGLLERERTVYVAAGSHSLSLLAEGGPVWRKDVRVNAGDGVTLAVDLTESRIPGPPLERKSRRWPWVVATIAAVAAATGITVWLLTRDRCDADACASVNLH